MESKVLKGFEFVVPIIKEIRASIEDRFRIKLDKDYVKYRSGIDSEYISYIGIHDLLNKINRFIIERGIIKYYCPVVVNCTVKHSPYIESKYWETDHFIIKIWHGKDALYIDPLTSLLRHIDKDTPDIYISDQFPVYLIPFKPRIYQDSKIFNYLEFKIKGRIYDWIGKKFHLRD